MIDTTKIKLHIRAMLAERPNNLYLINIKIKTRIKPIIMELTPFWIFSDLDRPNGLFLNEFHRCCQCTALSKSASSLASVELERPVIRKLVPNTA